MDIKKFLKSTKGKVTIGVIAGFLSGIIISGNSVEDTKSIQTVAELTEKVNKLEKNNVELENTKKELDEKIKEATPWFEMEEAKREEEIKKKEAEEKKKLEIEEKKRAEEEAQEKAKAEEAKKKKEAEEKKGYETGITYDNLARTPDKYEGKKVKFKGKIVQVMEGDGYTQMRMAVNSNYNQIIYIEIEEGVTKERILEDDVITIMGISNGLLSYESTMGGKITIPAVIVDKVGK